VTRNPIYRGRFAPSPTGPLHFGSLIAAVASYCQARSRQGEWLLRIENLDSPREVPGASDDIIRTLEAFGFRWDAAVSYQQDRHDYYLAALETLTQQQLIYPCTCSRKQTAKRSASIYPGTCRNGPLSGQPIRSWRIRTNARTIQFNDSIQGKVKVPLSEIGDFVLKRGDGIYSYQLTVAVDDALQGITEVVRGFDLLDSTPRQIYVQQQLNYSSPDYAHHPVAIDASGNKLSKQNLAPAIKPQDAQQQLYHALHFLGQTPPAELASESLETIWTWAIAHWRLDDIPKCETAT